MLSERTIEDAKVVGALKGSQFCAGVLRTMTG
jgi:hypothetical protein